MKRQDSSDSSDPSDSSDRSDPLIPKHGGYAKLRSYQTAQLIYDCTVIFCDHFIDKRSRTHDQMVQAARSGVRNIAEGSVASGTSKKIEFKLTGIAQASLEELLKDYIDFLRHRRLPVWDKDSPEALAVRHQRGIVASDTDPFSIRDASPVTAANTLICLINQATYLLRRQLESLEKQFLEHGGFTEKLHAARTQQRSKAEPPAPLCPHCSRPMIRRTARVGRRAG
jgi:restriction system protein